MTQDEIIRMAREAGFSDWAVGLSEMPKHLERFAALVAAHEREACAKVCEDLIAKGYQLEGELDLCAAVIRARGDK